MVWVARTICDASTPSTRKNITKVFLFFTCTATALLAVAHDPPPPPPIAPRDASYSSMTNAGAPFFRWRISRFVDALRGDAASGRVACHLSKFSLT